MKEDKCIVCGNPCIWKICEDCQKEHNKYENKETQYVPELDELMGEDEDDMPKM